MFKLSVPMGIAPMNEKTLPTYLDYVKRCDIKRVFLVGMGEIYDEGAAIFSCPEKIKDIVKAFKALDIEVGIWVNTLGHGAALVGSKDYDSNGKYTSLEGVNGDKPPHALCPADENFLRDYAHGIATIASFDPDIIMLDDDFRLGRSQYYFGCFCPKHLARFYELVGEEVPRGEIEEKIYTGGKNKYRDAYRKMVSETMMNFARRMREAVNSVDPSIRLGLAGALENWDADGLHLPDLARAFAGDTEPFFRTHGAPYWSTDIVKIIECTRMQNKWLIDDGIDEIMGEGDTYPRPRYNVPFKTFELFNYALIADENSKGMLGYIVDYQREPEYEPGYIEKYAKTACVRKDLEEMFEGKKSVGVSIYNKIHKIENWDLPQKVVPGIAHKMHPSVHSASMTLLSKNSIPSSWNENGYPYLVIGENAKTVDLALLKNGAVLDAVSAKILTERGVDVGYISSEKIKASGDYYIDFDATIPSVDDGSLYGFECKEGARILSRYKPSDKVSSYLYENSDGIRFLVLAYDNLFHYGSSNHVSGSPMFNLFNNYYRQEHIINAVEWMCNKPLPVKSKKNPNLYIYAAKDEKAMSVLLLNIHLDSIDEPVFELDAAYKEIKCINCTARLEGNKAILSTISGYGMAAFEVK